MQNKNDLQYLLRFVQPILELQRRHHFNVFISIGELCIMDV